MLSGSASFRCFFKLLGTNKASAILPMSCGNGGDRPNGSECIRQKCLKRTLLIRCIEHNPSSGVQLFTHGTVPQLFMVNNGATSGLVSLSFKDSNVSFF